MQAATANIPGPRPGTAAGRSAQPARIRGHRPVIVGATIVALPARLYCVRPTPDDEPIGGDVAWLSSPLSMTSGERQAPVGA